jgi:endonuclease/exonuclease/phosphatase family metal-dependent hydrolase
VTNIIFAAALLLAYLAVHINPDNFVIPAFFGLAYPYFLLINIIFIFIWIMFLKFEVLIPVIAISIGFNHFANYIKIGKRQGNVEGTFRVLSYNVRLFNYFENNNRNPDSEKKLIGYLKSREPDILCLQEYFGTGDPGQKEREIRSALGNQYNSHIKVIRSGKNRFYGIATFSRFPIVNRGELVHPRSSSLTIYSDIVINQDTFRVFNNHLQSFRLKSMERSFIEEITDYEEKNTFGELRSITSSLKRGFEMRASQARVLKRNISTSPYPVIVAGDFNDTPVSYTYNTIRKGLNDSFVSSGYGAGFTYKGNYPPNRIDYILYNQALESMHFDILKVRYSDHYPIMAWFRKRN